ncbi:hypothetical protein SEVIR_2G076600v4 [Setaria viridis]|uniref:SHSP domain-containing protein n=1 Tax=Setaria viridis TaxID=4556 RepID=A0A4U6VT12_SETVI|nr:uncharacterized protein LOC117845260 [Setaria viridis]TKW30999.1 hypothetical protein SEVIR_2G076600v2 [Setaria viridis]
MMSMVSPYTLLSRPAAPSGRISGMPLQPRKQATATAVAFPWARSSKISSPLSVCHANTYNVPPFALVHPKFPTEPKNNWKITEEADHINLWFKVEEATSKDELEVATNGNVLLIRYKGKPGNPTSLSPASSLDVRLLLPSGYENPTTMEAELTFGALLVTVAKPKQAPSPIPIRTSD